MNQITSRRTLLQAGGALIVAFVIRPAAAQPTGTSTFSDAKDVALDEADSYLSIGSDGNVTVYSGKVDLGTGIETAFTQIAAEER